MADSDPNFRFARSVIETLRCEGFQALLAGGCVRDILLGRRPKDFDVATDARPDQVREVFGHRRTLAVGASFGVVVVVPPKVERESGVEAVEVATFRTEGGYHDGRRPSHVNYATAEEDALRRDFTINGMFLDPIENQVFDFVGGQSDLVAGVIRAIGQPRERMTEDKLRLLRAIRFTATLEFRLDDETSRAVREMASQLTVVSAERVCQELRRMLIDRHRRRAMELCEEHGLLRIVVPELEDLIHRPEQGIEEWERTLAALQRLNSPTFELALSALLHAVAKTHQPLQIDAICRRLRLSNSERSRIVWLTTHQHDLENIQRRPLWFTKRLAANPDVTELIHLVNAVRGARGEALSDVNFLEQYLEATPANEINPPDLITGDDLIRRGLRPGVTFKRVLEEIRNRQLDGQVATPAEALDLACRLHAETAADTNDLR